MSEFKSKRCLVIDNGLFVHAALKLGQSFGKVWYWSPWMSAFPKSNAALPGDGFDEIERILEHEDYWDKADLIVFPDVGYGALQDKLVSLGKRVWGSRRGEDMELDRWGFKELLVSLDMPVAETHEVHGLEQLRRFLQQREGPWWVKTSRYRGDFETFEARHYDLVKPKLAQLQNDLGEKGEVYPFLVEKGIPAIIEIGYDGFTIDGRFADQALFGKESKDTGYIGVSKPYGELPDPILWVNAKLSPRLAKYGYRGWYSTEVRCSDECVTPDKPEAFEDCPVIYHAGNPVPNADVYAYLTDPCCRMPSPPSEAEIEWVDNWPEIVWNGAEGKLVEPEVNALYAVEFMLHSSFADKNWQAVGIPDEVRQWVKLRNHARINGVDFAVPQSVGLPEVGAVIGFGDTLQEAAKMALENAYQVEGYYLEAKTDALSKVIAEINNAQEDGIQFSHDGLPSAQEIEDLQMAES